LTGGLRIQICGRIAIERDGARLEDGLPGRQGRLLFVYLVANRQRPITRDELVDALWDRPPPSPDAALSALLSKLRRAIGPEWLGAGAQLSVALPPDAHVDLEAAHAAIHRAESALALGDPARAWGPAQVALFTARRGFLAGEDAPWIEETRRHLAALNLRALEAYGLAALRLGGTELAAAERVGRELVVLAPYRESGHRLLMEALAASGNGAESLRVYDDLRLRLRDDLGIAPCGATRALHEELVLTSS